MINQKDIETLSTHLNQEKIQELLKAKEWCEEKKKGFVNWICMNINYASSQFEKEDLEYFKTYYKVYLEAITNED